MRINFDVEESALHTVTFSLSSVNNYELNFSIFF